MTEIALRKIYLSGRQCLVPVDDEGLELLSKLKEGRDVLGDIKQSRNVRHHRLVFAILRFVQLHCERFEFSSTEIILRSLKKACGLVDRYRDLETGEIDTVLRSISWASMDQTAFRKFFDDACMVIAHKWMPAGSTPESVHDELIALVDGEFALERRTA